MTPIEALDQQLKAVCPIDGVSIGRWNNKDTWQIFFRPEATVSEQARAEVLLRAFDPATVPVPPSRADLKAQLQAAPTLAAVKAILNDLL